MPSLRTELALALAMTAPLTAQDGDAVPTEYVVQVPPGGLIDLDSGMILPVAKRLTFQADLRFGRDGAGFYLQPLWGGVRTTLAETEPPDELTTERVRLARHERERCIVFARTDRGMARVELMVADAYSTASASLRWVVVPPKRPVFLPPPDDLRATWSGNKLEVTWRGEQPRWLIEVVSGEQSRRVQSKEPRVALDGLDPKAWHRIVVRGMTAQGEISMPGDVVQFGPRQAPRLDSVDYPGHWYDTAGGLSLSTGTVATDTAEVVFYLYGVHVPGGGVVKVGTGERSFAELCDLPAGPLPPVYDRLADHDVLAVRLADGRYGKIWLQPTTGDLRTGMRAHFAFLPDGRRWLLEPPDEFTSQRTAAGVELSWVPVAGAVSYRVTVPGGAAPIEVKQARVVLTALAAARPHEIRVEAVAADGERSSPARTTVHTYGPEVRTGKFALNAAEGGFDFGAGVRVAAGTPTDLHLVGGAGGATELTFRGAALAPAGRFAFGEFPPPDQLAFVETWNSRARDAGADCFYVRTAAGGLASVRITMRKWPESEFEYVWKPGR